MSLKRSRKKKMRTQQQEAEQAREKMLNNEMDLIVTYVEEGFFQQGVPCEAHKKSHNTIPSHQGRVYNHHERTQ